jgi:ABC-type taurine transport system substrate-binding protein
VAITGAPVFDTLSVMVIHIDFAKKSMTVEGAFTNSRTTRRHAWYTEAGDIWSKETKEKVAELERLIEADLSAVHFGTAAVPAGAGLAPPNSGLAEHIGDDVPSM